MWNDRPVWKLNRGRAIESGADHARFDPAMTCWTSVTAPCYFFEPLCGEFTPNAPGSVVVSLGATVDRHRGVEVDVWEDGTGVSLWLPDGARVYWLPKAAPGHADAPWQSRLRELDPLSGNFVKA